MYPEKGTTFFIMHVIKVC